MRAAIGAVAVGLLLWSGGSTLVDLDVWHLMALFRTALERGAMPTRDLFAYTPTVVPVVQHEWGSGAVLHAAGRLGGLPALAVLKLVLTGVAVGFAVATALRRGASAGRLVLLGPVAAVMGWIGLTAVRPQLFTLAFLAALLWSLERNRQGRPLSFWWVPVFVVWANVHAGFVVGLIFLAAHAAERWARGLPIGRLIGIGGAVAPGIALNPYGLAYYPYLWHALRLERPYILEWRPLWESNPLAIGVVAIAIVLAVLALARVGPRAFGGWPLLALATYAGVRHERHVSMLAVVWLAYVPAALGATRLGARLDEVFARWGVPLSLVLLAGALTVGVTERAWELRVPGNGTGVAYAYPVGPEAYLRDTGRPLNVMTPFAVGAYLSWKLHPQVRVSLDSRFEVAYPPRLLAEHLDFFHGAPRWREVRDRYPTDVILVERGWKADLALRDEGLWPVVYEDDTFVLFARPGLALPYRDRRGDVLEGAFP